MKYLSRKQISLLLTIIALILWSFSITQANFQIGKYGLIGGFPIPYFIALGLMTIASAVLWTSKENHWKLLLVQLCFLVFSIFSAHLIVGGAQSLYSWSLGALGQQEYIVRTGHINPQSWQLWQHNWPGSDILQSVVLIFTGNTTSNYAKFLPWLPIIWQFLFFFPVFIFLKNTIGRTNPNYSWAGMWIFYLANWLGMQNNGPQPLGIFLAFSILALLSSFEIWKQNGAALGHRAILVTIAAAVTVGHFLSSLVVLFFLTGSAISRRLKIIIPIIIVLFVMVWAMYGATFYTTAKIPDMLSKVFSLNDAIQSGITNPVVSSDSRASVSLVRIIFSGLILLLGLIGGLVAVKNKQNRYIDVWVLSTMVAISILTITIGSGYSHELFNRFYLYLLPGLAYFGIKLLNHRVLTVILSVILIIGLPLAFISQYGNQAMDYLTPANLNGINFFHEETSHGWVDNAGPMGKLKNTEQYRDFKDYNELVNADGQLEIIIRSWNGTAWDYFPHYISFSTSDKAYYSFYVNQPELLNQLQQSLDVADNCNLIFSNPDMQLYCYQ
jgi:hypothetical protein